MYVRHLIWKVRWCTPMHSDGLQFMTSCWMDEQPQNTNRTHVKVWVICFLSSCTQTIQCGIHSFHTTLHNSVLNYNVQTGCMTCWHNHVYFILPECGAYIAAAILLSWNDISFSYKCTVHSTCRLLSSGGRYIIMHALWYHGPSLDLHIHVHSLNTKGLNCTQNS